MRSPGHDASYGLKNAIDIIRPDRKAGHRAYGLVAGGEHPHLTCLQCLDHLRGGKARDIKVYHVGLNLVGFNFNPRDFVQATCQFSGVGMVIRQAFAIMCKGMVRASGNDPDLPHAPAKQFAKTARALHEFGAPRKG
jgi:hypothetical protein